MLKNEIINDVNKYLEINNLDFYLDIVAKLNYYPEIIKEIVDDPYLLEAIRIHIEISNKWKISYTDKKYDNYPYRMIQITKNQNINIINQINALNNNSLNNIYDIKDDMYDNTTTMIRYFVFHNDNIDNYIIQGKEIYGIINIALGINIFNFLKYQRLDFFHEFINNENIKIKKSISNLSEYYKKNKSINFSLKDKIICMSGLIKTILGLTYSNKNELNVILNTENENYLKKISKYFLDYDNKLIIISNDKIYNISNDKNEIKLSPIEKNKKWIMQEYPNIIGSKNIYDIFSNPLYHFHFMGIKFVSLDGYIKKLILKASCKSYVDLIAMKNIININFEGLCIPYFNAKNGSYIIYDKYSKRKMYNCVMNKYEEKYNNKITIKNIKKILPMCSEDIYNAYSSKISQEILKKHHREIKKMYIEKYCKDIDVLIDVGSGKMNDLELWEKMNIKKIYVIEPNEQYIEEAMKKTNKSHNNVEIIFNNTPGDINWNKINIDETANCITLMFSMQYISHNLNILINNFNNFTQTGSYIIMFLMNGNKIHKHFRENKGKDIAYYKNNEPYFVIHPFYELNEKIPLNGDILVYMKDIRTINRGNIENIVDVQKIIDEMTKNEFELVENKYLGEIKSTYYENIDPLLIDVSNFFNVLIFTKV